MWTATSGGKGWFASPPWQVPESGHPLCQEAAHSLAHGLTGHLTTHHHVFHWHPAGQEQHCPPALQLHPRFVRKDNRETRFAPPHLCLSRATDAQYPLSFALSARAIPYPAELFFSLRRKGSGFRFGACVGAGATAADEAPIDYRGAGAIAAGFGLVALSGLLALRWRAIRA